MRAFAVVGALLGAAMAAPSIALQARSGLVAHPGGVKDVVVEFGNTLNSTKFSDKPFEVPAKDIHKRAANPAKLPLQFVNNYDGDKVNAYLSGLDSDGRIVFLAADGSLLYPSSGGSKEPVKVEENIAIPLPPKGETFKIDLPITITSARIYFCEGDLTFFMVFTGEGDGLVQPSLSNLADPSANLNWGFVELTYTKELVLYANISYVDFVGLILGMELSVTDGSPKQVTHGLPGDAVDKICEDLKEQTNKDGYPWFELCVKDKRDRNIRVLSNNEYSSIEPLPFEKYWQPYVDKVWETYSSKPLMLNTQLKEGGEVKCQVSGDMLNCEGDNRGYAKPTARDIWGCDSGPFGKLPGDNDIHLAVIPRLCAAFTRSTLLREGGDTTPKLYAEHYYLEDPTHHYSRIVHKYEIDGKGYSFAYDDVNPDGNENASGTVSSAAVDTLTIYVGAPPDDGTAPQPQPSSEPQPSSAPQPTPEPQPSPTPQPTPEPQPSSATQPESQSSAAPQPVPSVNPGGELNPVTNKPPQNKPQNGVVFPTLPVPDSSHMPDKNDDKDTNENPQPPPQTTTAAPPPAQPTSEAPPPPPAQPTTEVPPPPPAQPTTEVPPPPAQPTNEAPPPPPPAGGAQSGTCSQEGFWNCIDGTQYQRCASGSWSPLQPVAPGTTCVAGLSANLQLAKRMVKVW